MRVSKLRKNVNFLCVKYYFEPQAGNGTTASALSCAIGVMGQTLHIIVAHWRQVEKVVLTGPVNQSSSLPNRN